MNRSIIRIGDGPTWLVLSAYTRGYAVRYVSLDMFLFGMEFQCAVRPKPSVGCLAQVIDGMLLVVIGMLFLEIRINISRIRDSDGSRLRGT